MWIDDAGSVHTVWMPPEEVLGDESVAALRTVSDEVAQATLDAMRPAYVGILEEVTPHAPAGPTELDDDAIEQLPFPPVIPGLAPQPGEPLAQTVLRFVASVPPIWRLEVFEAVVEVLDRTPDELDGDDAAG